MDYKTIYDKGFAPCIQNRNNGNELYKCFYSYLVEKIKINKKFKNFSFEQIAGLLNLQTINRSAQGINFNNHVLVKKIKNNIPVKYYDVNSKNYNLKSPWRIINDRSYHNLIIEMQEEYIFVYFWYIGNKLLANYRINDLKTIYNKIKKRRFKMSERKIEEHFVTLSVGMISNSNGEGFEKKKNYQIKGYLINSWSEPCGVGNSTEYKFFEKENGEFILLIQENTRWQGRSYESRIEKFNNIDELPEDLYCMAGGIICL